MPLGIIKEARCPWIEESPSSKFKNLVHVAALYLAIVAALWCVPTCIYNRISETGQAVVLTLVDTASAELQNLAEPHLPLSDVPSKSSTNLTLPLSRPLETDTLILSSVSQLSRQHSIPTVLLTAESLNETEDSNDSPLTSDQPSQDDASKIPDSLLNKETTNPPEETQTSNESEEKIPITSNEETTTPGILDDMIETGHEDIPSFSEWAQKRLEEAEKKKTHPNASIQNNPGGPGRSVGSLKVRSKNYASPDCGAKIVAVNPEARSARSVLVSTRDEYMLNTCTSRIWFVVELCEAIQAKKIELANFELFSSSPKDLSVFVSDRFPTRDWSLVGQFTAQDERDIQSFTLHPHLFGKFIKVELHSHYGSEHFCPVSLFRAYGTSEFEVLETETEVKDTLDKERGNGAHNSDVDSDDTNKSDEDEDVNEDDEDYEIYNDNAEIFKNNDGNNDSTRNLFGTARDAVIRIVKKAAKVLVKTDNISGNNTNKPQESIKSSNVSLFTNCMTLKYKILCNNCTSQRFDRVFQLLSCCFSSIDSILKQPLIDKSLNEGELCRNRGFMIDEKLSEKVHVKNNTQVSKFLTSIFSPEYVIALCNVLAMREGKLLLNSSQEAVLSDRINATSPTDLTPSNSKVKIETAANLIRQTITSSGQDSEGSAYHSISLSRDSKTSQLDSSVKSVSSSSSSSNNNIINSVDTKKQSHDNIASATIAGSKIKPSKTLSKDDLKRDSSIPNLEPSKEPVEETVQAEIGTTPSPLINPATASLRLMDEPTILGTPTESLTQPSQISSHSIVEKLEEPASLDTSSKTDQSGSSQKVDLPPPVKQEEKKEKLKNSDEVVASQEQISEDTLFSDLRELENSDQVISNGPSTVSPPIISSTPQQKESVFLRLSNRIKALERNMSLSGQYLEELSKRYKKQVEEMQKSLERTTTTMGEEFRKGEEREVKRIEEISALREELLLLSESMQVLLYENNSWSNKLSTLGQHIVFIFVEIIVLILIVTYCRKSGDLADDGVKKNHQVHEEIIRKRRRRKSAESAVGEHEKGEGKKRRPSEIASRIAGSYRGLMIDERTETKKDRKRKRKKDSLMRLCSNVEGRRKQGVVLSRRSLSVDNPGYQSDYQQLGQKRPDSAPDCEWNWPEEDKNHVNEDLEDQIVIDELDGTNCTDLIIEDLAHRIYSDSSKDLEDSSKNSSPRGLKILKNAGLHSPSFMKTALLSRSKRTEKSIESESPSGKIKWEWYSRNSGNHNSVNSNNSLDTSVKNSINRETNGHHGASEDSESSSTTPTHSRKGKKESGFRKMVRRFF